MGGTFDPAQDFVIKLTSIILRFDYFENLKKNLKKNNNRKEFINCQTAPSTTSQKKPSTNMPVINNNNDFHRHYHQSLNGMMTSCASHILRQNRRNSADRAGFRSWQQEFVIMWCVHNSHTRTHIYHRCHFQHCCRRSCLRNFLWSKDGSG